MIRLRPITCAMKLFVKSWWNGVIVPAGPIQKKPPGWSLAEILGNLHDVVPQLGQNARCSMELLLAVR